MPRRCGDDDVERGTVAGDLLGAAGQDFDSRVTGRQDRPHPFVGLDGGHVRHPFGQEAGEDSGARPDLEDVRGSLRQQPIEGFGRRTGPKPVVVVGHGAEGPAQDGGGLVLAHAANLARFGAIGRRAVGGSSRPTQREAGGGVTLRSPDGRRDKVISQRGSGAAVAHHLAKVRVAGSNPVFRSNVAGQGRVFQTPTALSPTSQQSRPPEAHSLRLTAVSNRRGPSDEFRKKHHVLVLVILAQLVEEQLAPRLPQEVSGLQLRSGDTAALANRCRRSRRRRDLSTRFVGNDSRDLVFTGRGCCVWSLPLALSGSMCFLVCGSFVSDLHLDSLFEIIDVPR